MVGMFTDVSRIRERLISMVNRTCWRVSSSVCLKASVPYKSFLMQNCYRAVVCSISMGFYFLLLFQELNERWRSLQQLAEERSQLLGSAHEVQRFHRWDVYIISDLIPVKCFIYKSSKRKQDLTSHISALNLFSGSWATCKMSFFFFLNILPRKRKAF